jgi:hypothetical protein
MNVELVTRNFTDGKGIEHSYTVQQATVEVTLGRDTRAVQIERLSDSHVWHTVDAKVVVRFPTGSKEHVARHVCIIQRGDKWIVSVQGFRNRNTCTPIRWADDATVGSGWNG